ncbi:uncharacterized protein CC84DRAFT_1169397 [Paraphaeosphaeria sporulosa]|uniref:Uncharacterized protein n=1 Tax=Paraphaeosphaeria sporulosa TaxID=1460663 RepID=A0A177BVW8_9PLEO|nr:uncharacterized protein CC84DRAFT_1169397 [Paraphaeosphaeria sporulosa]OAF99255.1 hypothetical protein CC84DRAFT_1169397 [Paraphaeosphaeria sporulosa]
MRMLGGGQAPTTRCHHCSARVVWGGCAVTPGGRWVQCRAQAYASMLTRVDTRIVSTCTQELTFQLLFGPSQRQIRPTQSILFSRSISRPQSQHAPRRTFPTQDPPAPASPSKTSSPAPDAPISGAQSTSSTMWRLALALGSLAATTSLEAREG